MVKLVSRVIFCVILSASLLLSACAIGDSNEQNATYETNKAEQMLKSDRVKIPDSLVSKSKNLFLSNQSVTLEKKSTLPPVFDKALLYTTGDHEGLVTSLANIAKLTGQPIKVTSEAKAKLGASGAGSSSVVSYQGTFSQVLTQIANSNGLYWRYKDNTVEIYALETKVYSLDAPVGAFTMSNTINSTSDSSGGGTAVGGSSAMKLDYSLKTDSPWSAAIKTIQSMLSASGKMNTNSVEGYVTITDTPTAQKKVSAYIKKINDRTNKKIAVRVDVYDVESTSSSDFGFDMDAVVNALSNRLEVSSDTASLLDSNNTGALTSFTFSGGSHTHSVVLDALNEVGKTSEVTGSTIYTVSGQPAPIQSTDEQNYLESISTVTSDSDTTVSMTPGTVVSGYSMMVTPRIQSNGQILINLNIQISTLVTIENFSVDESDDSEIIQLPEVRSKNFLENMVLHNGQSILIAGFQDDSTSSTTGSPTTMDMWQAGGAKSTARDKSTTVIVVTPYIIGDE